MAIPDLQPYRDEKQFTTYREVLCIGWLYSNASFSAGTVITEVIEKLKLLLTSNAATNHDRSITPCYLCDSRERVEVDIDGGKIYLGSSEIWIPSFGHHVYAMPDMIYHYIQKHAYLPPIEFLESLDKFVLNSDWIADLAYTAIASKYHTDADTFIRASIAYILCKENGSTNLSESRI